MLSQADKDRISAAIAEAKSKTSGEIFCVLARDVSHYREVPLMWGAVAALVGPPMLVLAGLHRLALASIFSSWTDDSARAMEGLILRAFTTYGLLQAGLFLIVVLIVSLPRVRRVMTPGSCAAIMWPGSAASFRRGGPSSLCQRAACADFCQPGRPAGGTGRT